ncbi:MAG: hypothetical protein WB341_08170, partial [Terracidiphilus sp.]
MTLVAAFRDQEGGILLCADREENDGYAKRDVDKIYEISLPSVQVLLAGAGPSAAIARANTDIHSALMGTAFADKIEAFTVNALQQCQNIIESALRSVHKQFEDTLPNWPMNLLIVIRPKITNTVPILY